MNAQPTPCRWLQLSIDLETIWKLRPRSAAREHPCASQSQPHYCFGQTFNTVLLTGEKLTSDSAGSFPLKLQVNAWVDLHTSRLGLHDNGHNVNSNLVATGAGTSLRIKLQQVRYNLRHLAKAYLSPCAPKIGVAGEPLSLCTPLLPTGLQNGGF